MTANPARLHITPEDYLAAEDRAEFKSEYLDGEVFAMVGATEAHVTISMNLALILGLQLRGKPCRPFNSDMKILLDEGNKFYYPDISVVCGDPVYRDEKRTVLLNPSLIVEILSPSTEKFDREEKFAAYARIASLTDYILIAQDKPWVEHFARAGQGRWTYQAATEIGATLDIGSIDCKLVLTDIYDGIVFAPVPIRSAID